jgi:hypothetical protein
MSMTPMLARQFLDCILLVGHLDQGRTGGEPRQAIKKSSNDLTRAGFHRDVMVVTFLVFDILSVFVYMFVIPSHRSTSHPITVVTCRVNWLLVSMIATVFSSRLFGQIFDSCCVLLAAMVIIPEVD